MTSTISRPRIQAAFDTMRIIHPRIPEVHQALDDAREVGRLSPYSPKRYVEFFAPSHSGKSTAITTYIENVVVKQAIERGLFPADMDPQLIARKQNIVLHVTLSPKATPKSLASDILRRLGDKRCDSGNTGGLLARVYSMLEDEHVELVILDEIQHLASGTVKKPGGTAKKMHLVETTEVTDTLKTMMIRGLVPMVFVGIPEAREHLSVDIQLTNREMNRINFLPLDWSDSSDRETFRRYCGLAGLMIKKHGLMPDDTNFLDGDIPEKLWVSSGGCIGLVSRIAEEATIHAAARGAKRVEYDDLELAIDTRALPNNYCTYNAFRDGVRTKNLKSA
ncbi:MAG: hypothetical protein JWR51_4597 [Devosia sp.]|uniref:ATP-binding protein n=1 Tax=Devosia sp. TaxID=1871048 RepID=UPI002625D979|nr:ATP-binding protein [Devosia sp.]MDB5531494.1 hypothetical protein [Devosia sp.]